MGPALCGQDPGCPASLESRVQTWTLGPENCISVHLSLGSRDHSLWTQLGEGGRGSGGHFTAGALGVGGAGSAGERWGAAWPGGAKTQAQRVTAFRVEDGSRTGGQGRWGGLSSEEQWSPPQKPGGGQTGPGGNEVGVLQPLWHGGTPERSGWGVEVRRDTVPNVVLSLPFQEVS